MGDFNQSLLKLLPFEGGYSIDPNDRGKETYMGISRKNFPDWEGWVVIDGIKAKQKTYGNAISLLTKPNWEILSMVHVFYHSRFWPDELNEIDQQVCDELFDTAVNQGIGTAIYQFHQALNALNRNQKDYINIQPRNVFNGAVMNAYRSYMGTERYSTRNYQSCVKTLIKALNYYQMARYFLIAEKAEDQEVFLFGWLART